MTDGLSFGCSDDPTDGRNVSEPCYVLALVADATVRSRIESALPEACTTQSPAASLRASAVAEHPPFRSVDVLFVDESAFERRRERIVAARSGRNATSVVLVTDDRTELDADVWDDVDEVLPAAARSPAVQSRVETVLAFHRRRARSDAIDRVLEATADSVVAADIDRRDLVIRDVNPAFERTFGYVADAVVGVSLHELLVPPAAGPRARRLVDRVRTGETVETTARRTTRSGWLDVRVRIIPAGEVADADVYVVYSDAIEKRSLKQQVEVLQRVLRHNLRNDLNVILGNAELLADAVDGAPADEAAESIRQAADDLVDLGETASVLGTIWSPRGETTIDAVAAVDRTRDHVRETYPEADVRVDGPERAPVVGDRRIEAALYELCENAIEYDGRAEPAVRIAVDPGPKWTDVRVEDRGPGLSPTERAVLRGDDETPLDHGSGIGLWIVHWIVTVLGGETAITDNDPRGTAVTIRLRSGRRDADRGIER